MFSIVKRLLKKNSNTLKSKKKLAVSQTEALLDIEWSGVLQERYGLKFSFEYALMKAMLKKRIFNKKLNVAECGVYKGYGLLLCAEIASRFEAEVDFYGFDSFEGFPELSETDKKIAPEGAPYLNQTLFADTSFESVTNLFNEKGFKNIFLRKGFFSDSLPKEDHRKYFFVHIDCDLYDPHIECLDYFYDKTDVGGVILFDDYHSVNFPMAKLAIDKFLENKKEKLIHIRGDVVKDNYTKCFIVKGK